MTIPAISSQTASVIHLPLRELAKSVRKFRFTSQDPSVADPEYDRVAFHFHDRNYINIKYTFSYLLLSIRKTVARMS